MRSRTHLPSKSIQNRLGRGFGVFVFLAWQVLAIHRFRCSSGMAIVMYVLSVEVWAGSYDVLGL